MRICTQLSLVALVLAALLQFTVVRSADTGAAHNLGQLAATHNAELGGQTEASREMIAQQRKGILREQRQAVRDKVETALKHKVSVPQIAIGFMAEDGSQNLNTTPTTAERAISRIGFHFSFRARKNRIPARTRAFQTNRSARLPEVA